MVSHHLTVAWAIGSANFAAVECARRAMYVDLWKLHRVSLTFQKDLLDPAILFSYLLGLLQEQLCCLILVHIYL